MRLPDLLALLVLVAGSALSAELPPMPGGLSLETHAHYSLACAAAPDGSVWFTEFSHRDVRRYDPITGRCETMATGLIGAYGIAISARGEVYIGQDLGDQGNPGRVIRLDVATGAQQPVLEGLTRPRQLVCDKLGKLYVVCEGGSTRTGPAPSLMCLDPASGQVTIEASNLRTPEGVAVADDGTLFLSEYGVIEERPGRVLVRSPGGEWRTLAEGFWRARGLALGAKGQLSLTAESDLEDHGNGGKLVRIDTTTGAARTVLDDIDYPQFPCVAKDGRVYFVLNRDSWLAAYDPAAQPKTFAWPGDPQVTISCWGGSFGPSIKGTAVVVKVGDVTFSGAARGAGPVRSWLRLPADRLHLSPNELYTDRGDPEHPQPGLYALPEVSARAQSGTVTVAAIAERGHVGKRFPMTNVGTALEAPAAGFSESPTAYLVFVRWTKGGSR